MRIRIRKLFRWILILLVIAVGILLLFRDRYRDAIRELARTQVTNTTSDLINDAIDGQIEAGNIQYDRIVYSLGIRNCFLFSSVSSTPYHLP